MEETSWEQLRRAPRVGEQLLRPPVEGVAQLPLGLEQLVVGVRAV